MADNSHDSRDSNDEATILADSTDTDLSSAMPKTIGKYRVERVLGRGGMGTVYLALDPSLGRKVAIKMLLPFGPELSEDDKKQLYQRFLREAQSVAKLNHPNIVNVYSTGTSDNKLYIAMEYVDGDTLGNRLLRGQEMDFAEKLSIMQKICSGLQAIHNAGLVHRDLKPGNIMLGKDGSVKIMDFGTVRTRDSELTKTEQIIGTPSFMSPEQVQGYPEDRRSDIFSLGTMFYLFLTGEKPFVAESFAAVGYKVIHETPSPPSKLNSRVPKYVDPILAKAMAKSPEERFESCLELSDALGSKEAVEASAKSDSGVRIPKWVLGLALLLVLGVAAWAVFFRGGGPGLDKGTPVAGDDGQEISLPKGPPLTFQMNMAYRPKKRKSVRRLRDGEHLRKGDAYSIIFTPEEESYLYIFRVDDKVHVTKLFPEDGQYVNLPDEQGGGKVEYDNPVLPGQQYILPTPEKAYTLADAPGERRIFVVASRQRDEVLERYWNLLEQAQATRNTRLQKIYRFKIRMHLRRLAVAPGSTGENLALSWPEDNTPYDIYKETITLCYNCAYSLEFFIEK